MMTGGVHQALNALHGDLSSREAAVSASLCRLLASGVRDDLDGSWPTAAGHLALDLERFADELEARSARRRQAVGR